jgi:hypothetical protein
MKLWLIFVACLFVWQGSAKAMTPDEVSIDEHAVVMPLGRVLLINRIDFIGAIIFVRNEEKMDYVSSKYEIFEYEKGGGFRKIIAGEIFRNTPQESFWYNLRSLFLHDIGKAGRIKLRSFVLFADAGDESHSTVCFWDGAAKPDVKVRLAPTPWRDIREVKLSDPRIIWFGHDKGRERKVIPIDKIWD